MIFLLLCALSQAVTHANCSCKAGKVGYINYVLAFMFKACKFSLFDSKGTNNSCQDDDEQPDLACTSQLLKWNKQGRDNKISAELVMEVTNSKTKLDEARSRGVKCLIYDARCNPKQDFQAEMNFKKALDKLNPEMGFSIMAREDSSLNKSVFIL